MYTGYNYGSFGGFNNCGCQQPYYPYYNQGCGGYGQNWFAIVLVIFLLLIICGCNKIC